MKGRWMPRGCNETQRIQVRGSGTFSWEDAMLVINDDQLLDIVSGGAR